MGGVGACVGMLLAANVMAAELTPAQKEWHEYCEMTVHTKVTGWVTEKTQKEVSIPVDASTLRCKTEVYKDFLGNVKTNAVAYLSADATAPLMQLKTNGASSSFFTGKGAVPAEVACAPVKQLLEEAEQNGGVLKTVANREVVRQDWTSSKNVDVRIHETVTLSLGDLQFHGSGQTSARGEYCSKKP